MAVRRDLRADHARIHELPREVAAMNRGEYQLALPSGEMDLTDTAGFLPVGGDRRLGAVNAVLQGASMPAHVPTTAASRKPEDTIPRLALTKLEAAQALGVSVDFLEAHIMRELRIIRLGRRRLIPVAELARWLDASAHRTVGP